MTTYRVYAAASVLAVAALTAAVQHADAHRQVAPMATADCVQGEVVAFRARLASAIAAKDKAKLRRMYSSAFIQTHGTGLQDDRDARIASVLGGDPVIETLQPEKMTIRMHNEEGCTGVATGRSSRTMPDGSVQNLAWTAVYVRNDETWRLAASHVTRLAEAKK